MRHFRVLFAITVVIIIILSSACVPASEATTTSGENAEPQFADFDPDNFDNSTVIDNEWTPMQPGTKWVYEEPPLRTVRAFLVGSSSPLPT